MKRKAAHSIRRDGASLLPPTEIEGLIDELRATVIALLASLQAKERELCDRAGEDPSAGLARGLSDIYVLRRWADRMLRTIDEVEKTETRAFDPLLGELSRFAEILRRTQPSLPPEPPLAAVG